MIEAIYVLRANEGSLEDLADLLKIISGRTSYQIGCMHSHIWYNMEKSEIMLMESWKSVDDLMIHISSKLFKRLLAAMEMSSAKPEISYYKCENYRGMDLIEEVLLSGDRIYKSKQ